MTEKMQFANKTSLLNFSEFLAISQAFVNLGIKKIRLTGGEPLIYPQIIKLCSSLKKIGVQHLAMTSNGVLLETMLEQLRTAGLDSINISIDTLNSDKFKAITRVGGVNSVIKSIIAAKKLFKIKLNAVLLPQHSIAELLELIEFALANDLSIRFIEEMPLGGYHFNRASKYTMAQKLLSALQKQYKLTAGIAAKNSGPATIYTVANSNCHIGFISALSDNFCSSCNRVRVSATGDLINCLGNEQAINIKSLATNTSIKQLQKVITNTILSKPEQHHFNDADSQVLRFMNVTGG